MRVAIVGCGSISRMHLGAIDAREDAELICACDIVPERVEAAVKDRNAKAYTDFDEMINHEELDVLHICTPHYLHVPMAIKALKKGVSVLSEKPEGISYEQIEALIKAEEESSGIYGVCFQNRYNRSVRALKKIIDTGDCGELKGARGFVTWDRAEKYFTSSGWRGVKATEGGSVMINQAIHTVDLMNYLGGDFEVVNAVTSTFRLSDTIETEDTATALFKFENGARGIFYATLAYTSNAPVILELQFENRTFRLEMNNLYECDNSGKIVPLDVSEAVAGEGKNYWGDSHAILIDDFYTCIKNKTPFMLNAKEGSKAIKTVLDIYQLSGSYDF